MIETVERNNRFYTNEKGEIKTENEQLKEWLIIANKENERLNNNINKTIHRIQLLQMDGKVTIRDLTELVNMLKGSE